MNHSLNLTHDGTLIVRVPKGYKVEKVKVETFEGEEIPTHTTRWERWIVLADRR